MKVHQLMNRNVQVCRPGDSLDAAARIMWERDCGCVPVVSDEEGGTRVIGMLTDRDICMAAWTQGRPLGAIPVSSAMSHEVASCRPTDSIQEALSIVRARQIRRLPVVDTNEHLVGLLSLADVAREANREHASRTTDVKDSHVAGAIEAISQPRSPRDVVRAA